LTVRLFVYGTLAPGREAWPVLAAWVIGAPATDAVAGRLYDTDRGYPGATFGPDSDGAGALVHGTIVTLDPDRAPAAFAALDRYEGAEYERITVRTEAGVEAATYAWIAPLTGCRPVESGRFGA
jgi:gamma-glutamylcyclotransferase (GGCT)/AIG2-like uncharacterized protein YtfP